ncbi:MMPL family transporter [Corynebacterium heidelbergense]|uniref:MMPL family transporter n=1 Tax=Corynebacterium heidelbergense TaxID=2055947 RepID=A0A364VAP3_9CORY|nr:MMPL family transporter [Corynebacterium heidelbergense]RAV33678.1 MMPL family transporter [Corynebacterium heidelbergense]WCZ37102.1 Membrane protein YdfJ [Corynebacterium heidelbergense]
MASLLYRLGRSAYLHKWRFIAVWLLLILGVGGAAAAFYEQPADTFTIPGIESVETQDKIKEKFPNQSANQADSPSGKLVLRAPDGKKLTDPDVDAQVKALVGKLRDLSYLKEKDSIAPPPMAAEGLKQKLAPVKQAQGIPEQQIKADLAALSPLSQDQTTGTVQITFDAPSNTQISDADRNDFSSVVEQNKGDLQVAWSGPAFQSTQPPNGSSELIGIAVAAIVLIITFGSFVAAGLPLLTAVVGVGIGIAGVFAATSLSDAIGSMTPTLASMIGLAVGIDYALFILSRFRSELIAHVSGEDLTPKELAPKLKAIPLRERAHLAGLAVGKAGSAVVFAGTTVLIALAALSIVNIPFLTAMALAAAATVFIAVLVAITLLPAIVGLIGTKVFSGRAPVVKAPDPENETPTMGLKWVRLVRKHPRKFVIATVLLMGLLAIPAASLRLAMPNDGSKEKGTPNRTAYEMVDESFGPGRNAPMVALVEYDNLGQDQRAHAVQAAVQTLQGVDGVQNAQVTATNGDQTKPGDVGTAAQILVTPKYGATDEKASETLQSLRDKSADFHNRTGASYAITGVSPTYEDISDRLSGVLLPYIGIVIVLAFLLLMLVFRSIWVPLLAALGFALSVAATFGVTVALWQQGFAGIISDPQPIISFLPIMLIGLVFGLAMDYQVFLVTRMREGWAHGKPAGNAVANGFKHGARVVTAAALIMISVFAAFMLNGEQFIMVMGFALATAVFFDAFIIRMTFIPAVMFLLGERAWKIPGWLNKILPTVDVEGESLQHKQADGSESAEPTGGPKHAL